MDAFQHQNTFQAEFEINFQAYLAHRGRAVLLYEVQYFDERGAPCTAQKFLYDEDEKSALNPNYKDSLNIALNHARRSFSEVIVSKGLKIIDVEWAQTIPWSRKKYQEQLTEAYNNQDITSQYNDQGINLLPKSLDDMEYE